VLKKLLCRRSVDTRAALFDSTKAVDSSAATTAGLILDVDSVVVLVVEGREPRIGVTI